MDNPERLDPDTLDRVLERVLAADPNAAIAAVTPEGGFCALPGGFDAGSRQVLPRGSAMDFVPPGERLAVIEGWQQAHEIGASTVVMRSGSDPDSKLTLHLVDAMHRYGVYFAVMIPDGAATIEARPIEAVRDTTKMGRVRKDAVSTLVDADAGAIELLGFPLDELTGRRSLDFIHPDDHDRAIDCWMAMLADPGGMRSARLRHLRKDGSYLWVDISNRNLLDGPEECVVADMVDVSDEMAAQEALREREQLLARLTEALPLGVLQIDLARRVVFTNQRLQEIVGRAPATDLDDQLATIVTNDQELLEEALAGVLTEGTDQDVQVRARRPGEKEPRLLKIGLRALTSEAGRVTGAVACVEDVTESMLLHLELENRASHDALTGCFNRASVMSSLEEILASDLHEKSGTALVFFDVDNFKQVNDELGHAVGDDVLRIVAERAEDVFRDHDIVGRLGGDEFLVVCPGISDEHEAMPLARRVSEVVGQPVTVRDHSIDVQVSIGVVWCDSQNADAEWLVAEADRVMYESKSRGTGEPIGRPARAVRTG